MNNKEWESFEKFVKNKGIVIKMLSLTEAQRLLQEWFSADKEEE